MTRILNDLFPLGFLVLFLKSTKLVQPVSGWVESPLSPQAGNSVRALFSVIILLHHLGQTVQGLVLFPILAKVGYLGAAAFFFLSGYGLQKQYMKNPNYAKTFLLRRLPPILIPVFGIGFFYWVMYTQMFGQFINWKVLWLQITWGDPIISFSWYVVVLIAFYLAFQVMMLICGKRQVLTPLLALFWYIGLVWVCKHRGFSSWWYNTAHVLVAGLLYAVYEKPVTAFFRRHYLPAFLICALSFGALQAGAGAICRYLQTPWLHFTLVLIRTVLFMILLVLILQKVTIQSKIIDYLGKISLEVYLLQGLFLTLLRNEFYYLQSDFLECILVLILTMGCASVLHPVFAKIGGFLRKK